MEIRPYSDLVRQGVTSDSLGRYYTPRDISRTLVHEMSGIRPKVILELGAGYGAIANAASEKWTNAKFITVDADKSAKPKLSGLAALGAHTHHVHDALDGLLAERIGLDFGSVDVGLCNPPYVRPRWRKGFGLILEGAGLSGALNSVHDAGADLLFIAQNLRLLKNRGKLGLVLPDGLVTGEKFQRVRSVLLRQHLVEQVIQLPRRVFAKTEAQTYLMILSKDGGETQSVQLRSMGLDGTLSSAIEVGADVAARRLDHRYHLVSQKNSIANSNHHPKLTIGDVTEQLIRGSLNSNQIDGFEYPVFHLGNFPQRLSESNVPSVPSRFVCSKRESKLLPNSVRVARQGDILVARVGRNLHTKVSVLLKGACVISDCIYALRIVPEHRETILTYLTSNQGQRALEAVSHGVGAKYLSRSDLLELIVPI